MMQLDWAVDGVGCSHAKGCEACDCCGQQHKDMQHGMA
jgi:hypothetical protein